MLIRRMIETDLMQVAKLEKEIFSQPWSPSDFQQVLSDQNKHYFVAEQEGEIKGYCGLWAIAFEGQIFNVAVVKEARSKGLGRALMVYMLAYGIKLNLAEFSLEVRAGNKNAISLYKDLGFQVVGTRRDFYKLPQEDALLMTAISTVQFKRKMLEYCCGGIEYGTEDGDAIHKAL